MKHKRDFKCLRNLPLIFSTPELLRNLYNLDGWQKFPWINLKKPIESRFNLQGYNFTWTFFLGIFRFFHLFSKQYLTKFWKRLHEIEYQHKLQQFMRTLINQLILVDSIPDLYKASTLKGNVGSLFYVTLHGPVKATIQYPVKHLRWRVLRK